MNSKNFNEKGYTRLIYALVVLMIVSMAAYADSSAWSVTISATNPGNGPVTFGVDSAATNDYDGAFDAFLNTPINEKVNMMLDDVYSTEINSVGSSEWTLAVGVPATTQLSWDASGVPSCVTLTIDGTDMKTTTTLNLGAGDHFLDIKASACQTITKSVVEAFPLGGGAYKDTDIYANTQDVYVKGAGFGSSVDVYVMEHKDWSDNMVITGWKSMKSGKNISDYTLLWSQPLEIGKYDVVVDSNKDGKYNSADGDYVDGGPTVIGFEVLPELATVALLGSGLFAFAGYVRYNRKK
jgi:hypothetical protein